MQSKAEKFHQCLAQNNDCLFTADWSVGNGGGVGAEERAAEATLGGRARGRGVAVAGGTWRI